MTKSASSRAPSRSAVSLLLSGADRASSRPAVVTVVVAIPGTDNALVTLEHASDDELHSIGHQHLSLRQAALDDEATSRSGDAG